VLWVAVLVRDGALVVVAVAVAVFAIVSEFESDSQVYVYSLCCWPPKNDVAKRCSPHSHRLGIGHGSWTFVESVC